MGLASSTEVFSQSRSTPWLRVPPPCPFLSRVRTSRYFATGPPSRTCPTPRCRGAEPPVAELGSEKDPLLRFDSPSEYDRGALPERLSPFLSRRLAPTRSGPPLLGFFVPTTFDSRCPVSATIGSTDRGRRELPHPRPVPPSGFVHSTELTQLTQLTLRCSRCSWRSRPGFRCPSAV